MRKYKVAAIGGDGIGPEVLKAGMTCIREVGRLEGFEFSFQEFPWGSNYYRETGLMMPTDGLAQLKNFDAIYFGAVGDPNIPDDVTLWGLRIAICQGFDLYANVRPAVLLPGVESPLRQGLAKELDWVVIRENSEGEYAGAGGRSHQGHGEEVAIDTSVFSRKGVERIQRYAFKIAAQKPNKKVSCITKSNAQRFGMVLWDEVFTELAEEYSNVETDKVLVDAAAARMVLDPGSFDVIVASNLHGDILSDLAGALSGSLGLSASGNIDPTHNNPSMFEPVHGSAPDIDRSEIANPIATIWSGAMLCEHLGEVAAAKRLKDAICRVTKEKAALPRDLGGQASTSLVTEAIVGYL